MSERLSVLMPSDVFPPRCGGAGWSAHALARALIEREHGVVAIVPRRVAASTHPNLPTNNLLRIKGELERRSRIREATRRNANTYIQFRDPSRFFADHFQPTTDVLGVPTVRVDYWAPQAPFIQNYFRYERFWPQFAKAIVNTAQLLPEASSNHSLLIHAQHVQSAAAAIRAGRALGAPVVITVRDHWPWDYFNTGLHANQLPYPLQTWASLATDLVARLGAARGALALPAIPYMLRHLWRRQQALRQADAVIAVSEYMARRLAALVAPERLHVIPNMVDLAVVDRAIATPQSSVPAGTPYLMFVGKLERNKGAHLLVDIFRALVDGLSSLAPILYPPTLVVAGDGPLRAELERELSALGVRTYWLDWVDHDEALRLMAGCDLLLFPSAWGEPLSRVPIEASACGAAVLAMPTGGTPSIIAEGVNGALEHTVPGFARRLAALLADPAERRRLGAGARLNAEQRFAKDVVVGRVERLYWDVVWPGG